MLIHGGLPLAFASGKHHAFLLIPELNIGFATSSVSDPDLAGNAPDASLAGFRLDAGARTGMEVHFGFMDLPNLSLEGTVGAFLSVQNIGADVGGVTASESDILLTTTSFSSPWDIFRSTVAARYYF
jgi:hypothetical protein